MKVGIIGLGVVGLSFASVLGSKGFSVIGMDSDEQKIEKINSKKYPRTRAFRNLIARDVIDTLPIRTITTLTL